jgi:hypothetical protein
MKTEKQYKKVTSAKVRKMMTEYAELKESIKESDLKAKALLEQITIECGHVESQCLGFKLMYCERHPISYSAAFKDLMPDADLSKYTNYSSFWRIA